MNPNESPKEPFFADKLELVIESINRQKFQCKKNIVNSEYGYDNSVTAALARAAVLHFMLKGYMMRYRWWVLAAEAIRCFEQAPEGRPFPVPTRTMSKKQEKLIQDLFDVQPETIFLQKLNNDDDTLEGSKPSNLSNMKARYKKPV